MKRVVYLKSLLYIFSLLAVFTVSFNVVNAEGESKESTHIDVFEKLSPEEYTEYLELKKEKELSSYRKSLNSIDKKELTRNKDMYISEISVDDPLYNEKVDVFNQAFVDITGRDTLFEQDELEFFNLMVLTAILFFFIIVGIVLWFNVESYLKNNKNKN